MTKTADSNLKYIDLGKRNAVTLCQHDSLKHFLTCLQDPEV